MGKRQYFGTDGIRGEVGGDTINPEFMLHLGWAAGTVFMQRQTAPLQVLIGKDTRHSGDLLESALMTGLLSAGVNVMQLGVLPTSAVAYLTHILQATAGIMISASHNCFKDNGVKLFSSQGRKIDDAIELAIEKQLTSRLCFSANQLLGRASAFKDALTRYIEFCKSTFPTHLSLQGLKLAVDCANGAAYQAASIFSELGADVKLIAAQPDGTNINQQCGSTDLRQLQEEVLVINADVGIAFDGDADRLLMVDHQGVVVDGDELLGILACYHEDKASLVGVVGTAMSNLGLERALKQAGIIFERVAVGDRYVLECLLKRGWFLGGESSGHLINLHYTTTGDGIIAALQILAVMQRLKRDLYTLKQVVVKRPQVLINVPANRRVDISKHPEIELMVAKAEQQLGDAGRVLLRSSGTEPVIRVMVEGDDESKITRIAQQLADHVAAAALPKSSVN